MDSRLLQAGDPTVLGRWALTARLGRGTTSIVYRAIDDADRVAAVKVAQSTHPGAARMLRREAELLGNLTVGGVARLVDQAQDEPTYFAMELVDGPTLEHVCDRSDQWTASRRVTVAMELAVTLKGLHAAGTAHGDVKPANIVLGRDGAVLVDFGNSFAEASPRTWWSHRDGSPAFLAPEVLDGSAPTPEADVFAWAATVASGASQPLPHGLVDLVLQAGDPNPRFRPSAAQLTAALAALAVEAQRSEQGAWRHARAV